MPHPTFIPDLPSLKFMPNIPWHYLRNPRGGFPPQTNRLVEIPGYYLQRTRHNLPRGFHQNTSPLQLLKESCFLINNYETPTTLSNTLEHLSTPKVKRKPYNLHPNFLGLSPIPQAPHFRSPFLQ